MKSYRTTQFPSRFTEEELQGKEQKQWFAIIADRVYSFGIGRIGFESAYAFSKFWKGRAQRTTLTKLFENNPRLFLQS